MPDFLDRFGQTNDKGQRVFSTVRSGLIVSLLSIGTLIGALIAAPIADRIGRKYSISFWNLIIAIGFLIQISSNRDWVQIMMGRWVAGLGVGALSLLVPMYQAETSPPWIRGAMVCTYQLFITFGIFLAACFNYGTVTHHPNSSASWRIVMGLGWVYTLVLGIGILFFPETPRFDYRRGKVDRAERTLCKVYGATPNHWSIHTQMEEIGSKLRAEQNIKRGPVSEFLSMFRAPRMAYRIFIGMSLQMFQQLSMYPPTQDHEPSANQIKSWCELLLLLRHNNLPFGQYRQLYHADYPQHHQLSRHIHRSLHCRALWPSQVPHCRQLLDVCVLSHLCFRRPLRPGSHEP